jgi:hypothetical protein
LQKELERQIEQSRHGMHSWAVRLKAVHPEQPVYFKVKIRSEDYIKFIPLLGWVPERRMLFLSSIGVTTAPIEAPEVTEKDESTNLFHSGKTIEVTYTELVIP